MALIDAGFRTHGDGQLIFTAVAKADIRVKPSPTAVVTYTFTKVLRETRSDSNSDEPYGSTIAYREFVWMGGTFHIALDIGALNQSQIRLVEEAFRCVNYFGKRGSFCQLVSLKQQVELDPLFSYMLGNDTHRVASSMVVQYLDDFNAKTTFANVNTYDGAPGQREFRLVGLPYQYTAPSRHYTLFKRVETH